ncbi:hypothetical protein Tco_0592537 [Tanacetum coccineum]
MKRVNTFVDYGTELVEESSKKAETELVEESSKKSEAEIAHESSLKRVGEELEQESSKKQKLEEDKEFEELKQCLELMLHLYLLNLQPLLTTRSTKKERKTIFKLLSEQMNQQGLVKVLNWKLYDSCGVHCVTMQSMLFYLLVEKMYPLTNHTLHQMFNDVKLQVDYECEMAFELLRLVKKQLKEGYGRIVRIKSLLEVTAAKVCVTAAKQKKVTTAQRLRLLKEFLLSEENG